MRRASPDGAVSRATRRARERSRAGGDRLSRGERPRWPRGAGDHPDVRKT